MSYTLDYMYQVKERQSSKKTFAQNRRSNIGENDEEGDDSMAFVNGKPHFKKDDGSTRSIDDEDKATDSFLSWNT